MHWCHLLGMICMDVLLITRIAIFCCFCILNFEKPSGMGRPLFEQGNSWGAERTFGGMNRLSWFLISSSLCNFEFGQGCQIGTLFVTAKFELDSLLGRVYALIMERRHFYCISKFQCSSASSFLISRILFVHEHLLLVLEPLIHDNQFV